MNDPNVPLSPTRIPSWSKKVAEEQRDAHQDSGRRLQSGPLSTMGRQSSTWLTVRNGALTVVVRSPLPPRWADLFVDFRKQMRPLALPTRRELIRHIWRQFITLPMVEVHVTPSGLRGLHVPLVDLDMLTPDEMHSMLQAVARAVRRQIRWPLLSSIYRGRGLDG